jgi:NAD-dependent dihydropyrimidine dehydrogenase PreA subunit
MATGMGVQERAEQGRSGPREPRWAGPQGLLSPQLFRRASQITFAAFIVVATLRHELIGEDGLAIYPEPEAYCPFGGLETLYFYVTTGGNTIRHTSVSNVVLAGSILLVAFLARSAFCGWICPLGFLQEMVARMGGALQRRIPGFRQAVGAVKRRGAALSAIDRPLRLLKYGVLMWAVTGAAVLGVMVFKDYCPWAALTEIAGPALTFGMVVLIGMLVASLFVPNPWCRYACPLGAVAGLFGRLSPVFLRRKEAACQRCGACSRACPMGLPVDRATEIRHPDCTACLECVNACPQSEALEVKIGLPAVRVGPARRLNPYVLGGLVLLLFMAPVVTAQATGNWSASRKAPTGASVEELKGAMMLGNVATAYRVPMHEIVRAFDLPPDTPPTATLKDLQSQGLTIPALRSWLTQRTSR